MAMSYQSWGARGLLLIKCLLLVDDGRTRSWQSRFPTAFRKASSGVRCAGAGPVEGLAKGDTLGGAAAEHCRASSACPSWSICPRASCAWVTWAIINQVLSVTRMDLGFFWLELRHCMNGKLKSWFLFCYSLSHHQCSPCVPCTS